MQLCHSNPGFKFTSTSSRILYILFYILTNKISSIFDIKQKLNREESKTDDHLSNHQMPQRKWLYFPLPKRSGRQISYLFLFYFILFSRRHKTQLRMRYHRSVVLSHLFTLHTHTHTPHTPHTHTHSHTVTLSSPRY
jgi:hypothetical protein